MSNSALPDISGYNIIREIGRGSTSVRYLALQKSTARQVAVAVLHEKLIKDRAAGDYYLGVVRSLSTVSHPNVLKIHEAGRTGNSYYLVTEYVEGGNLRARAEKGIGPEESLRIVRALASGLVAIHSTGFIHMDIKPEKILFREDGTPVLGGNGMAGLVDPRLGTGTLGTPEYMAPWQGLGKTIDSRGDLYSLGIVLYEMLTGEVPYKGSDRYDIGYAHINHPVPSLPEPFAQRLQPLLERMLAKDPSDRYADADVLIAAIDEVEVSTLPKGAPKVPADAMPPKPQVKAPTEKLTLSGLAGIKIGDDEEIPDFLLAGTGKGPPEKDKKTLQDEISAAMPRGMKDPGREEKQPAPAETIEEEPEVLELVPETEEPGIREEEEDVAVYLHEDDESMDTAIPVDDAFLDDEYIHEPEDGEPSDSLEDSVPSEMSLSENVLEDAEPFTLEPADEDEDDREEPVYVIDDPDMDEPESFLPDDGADQPSTSFDTDAEGDDGGNVQDINATLNRYEEMMKESLEREESDFASGFTFKDKDDEETSEETSGDEQPSSSTDGEFGIVDISDANEASPGSGGEDVSEEPDEMLDGYVDLSSANEASPGSGGEDVSEEPDVMLDGYVDLSGAKEAASRAGGTDVSEEPDGAMEGYVNLPGMEAAAAASEMAPPMAAPHDFPVDGFAADTAAGEQEWSEVPDMEKSGFSEHKKTRKRRSRIGLKREATHPEGSGGILKSILSTAVFLLLLIAIVGAGAYMYRDRQPVKGWIEKLEKTAPIEGWLEKLRKAFPVKGWFGKAVSLLPGPGPAAAEPLLPKNRVLAARSTDESAEKDASAYSIDKRAKISGLLAAAEADMKDGRLSRPRGGSALGRYREVLKLDPRNAEALKGLDRIMMRYIDMARSAVKDGNKDGAARFLDRADEVSPGWENVRAIRNSLGLPGAAGGATAPAGANDQISMVYVRGGCFQMGCGPWTSNCSPSEKPAHKVCLSDFFIGRFEVTQGQWREVMGGDPSRFGGCDTCPVEQVSWNDAQNFIEKLNKRTRKKYRLPTVAEWEYAARSRGGKQAWAGTSDLKKLGGFAWYDENSGSATHSVGEKLPNGLGIYDMSGNVLEWCQDFFAARYYSKSPRKNPSGPATGDARSIRGGSWLDSDVSLRTSSRGRRMPDFRQGSIGFRLALTP